MRPQESTDDGILYRCVTMPNGSLTPVGAGLFLAALAIPLICISVVAWQAGAWLILPFSGIEFVAVAWALGYGIRQSRYREVVSVTDQWVRVESGILRPENTLDFDRFWTSVSLEPRSASSCGLRLLLRNRGRSIEVGRFLTDDERKALAVRIQRAIGPMGQ
ncbi:MAG: DUF2244 domain-containing protein [Pseudomonadota bacterium]|nr:DUF2244 domain-containing protein [Pseudomonadota bacterium]